MTTKIVNTFSTFLLAGYILILTACVKEDFEKVPVLPEIATWKKTVTIAQLKSLYTNKAILIGKDAPDPFWDQIIAQGVTDSSVVFEGYVISSDSAGNFYETVCIMDETGGIDLKINAAELYLTHGLKPGRKVLVKVNSMVLDNYQGVFQVGRGYTDAGVLKVTGLDLSQLPECIQRSGLKEKVDPVANLKINEVSGEYVQKLIKLDSVQFWNPAATFSIPGVNTNRILVDKQGRQLILRNSGYASFANEIVPSGSGSITAVLGIYSGTYQLYIRDLNDIDFKDPRFGTTVPTPNLTIAELKALCTSNLVLINQEVVVQGVVNANDESGNLYKQLFIEDETGGIEFKIDIAGLYTDFPVGTKIIVNCNGLYLGKYGGVVQLGGIYNSSIGRLSASQFYNKVFIVSSGNQVNAIETTISGINDQMLGKLVTLTDVQFMDSDMGKTWAESNATTNRYLENFAGNSIIVRTSNFASFAGIALPRAKGKITAVLSKFVNDYQLYIRSLADVKMIEPRWVKTYMLSQTFSGATLDQPISVDSWQSIAEAGTRRWMAKEYPSGSGAKYAEMNPYQSGEPSNIGWLISPKTTLPAGLTPYLSFETQYNFWANSTLQVFISTNYDGSNPATATWTELTGARIVVQADGTNKWVKSGLVDLSAYSGDIYIGFKYTGSGSTGVTTAYRVDNVEIFTKN